MRKPLVSVLMPAYNAEKYISDSIKSILVQTYKNFELIIANDASTDDTISIIENYAKKDKRIIVVNNKKNLYIAGNRNKLISLAKGKYIAWQDADDISMPERLDLQVQFLENNKDVGVVGAYIQSFNENKNLDIRSYSPDDKMLRKNIFKFSPIAQPVAMIRKECFDKVGLFNLECPPAEDLDMWFRIGSFYKFANIQKVLLKYREQPNNATNSKMKKMIKETLKIRKKNFKNKAYRKKFTDFVAFIFSFLIIIFPALVVINLFKKLRKIL